MEKEIRKPRAYKIADTPYNKAIKKGNGQLATLIEKWVTAFGKGHEIVIYQKVMIALPKGLSKTKKQPKTK